MTFSFRPFLVVFLVLLQCIAPLVHAHTGEPLSSQGVHIPGLEAYSRSVASVPLHDTAAVTASAFYSDVDGQVVGVDTGVSREIATQRLHKLLADLAHGDYLPSRAVVFIPARFIGVSPLSLSMRRVYAVSYSVHAPRAPPLHA